jgi:hypothetical protein
MCSALDWEEFAAAFQDLLAIAVANPKTQGEFAMRAMVLLRLKFIECELQFAAIYAGLVFDALDVVSDATRYALEFMLACGCWNLNYEFPISMLGEAREFMDLDAIQALLKLLRGYLKSPKVPCTMPLLNESFGVVVHFILAVIADSRYSRFIKLEVKLLITLIIAANENEVQEAVFYQAMLDAVRAVFPNPAAVQTAIEFAKFLSGGRADVTVEDRKYDEMLELVRTFVISTRSCFPTCGAVFAARETAGDAFGEPMAPSIDLDPDAVALDA